MTEPTSAEEYFEAAFDGKTFKHIFDYGTACVDNHFSSDEIIPFFDKHEEEILEAVGDELTIEFAKENYPTEWGYKRELIMTFIHYISCSYSEYEEEEEDVSEDYEAREYDSEVRDLLIKKAREGPLVGEDLLRLVYELGDVSKSDMVLASGYVSKKEDGGERLNFTAFYEALLNAKGIKTHEEEDLSEISPYENKEQQRRRQRAKAKKIAMILGGIVLFLFIWFFATGTENTLPVISAKLKESFLYPIGLFARRYRLLMKALILIFALGFFSATNQPRNK